MPAPANDNFASALALTGSSTSAGPINAAAATVEASEPQIFMGFGPFQTTWYRWTAPASGLVVLDFAGSTASTPDTNFDIGVYTGSVLASLTPVTTFSFDSADSNPHSFSFTATSGTTYRIQVSTEDVDSTVSVTFTLNIVAAPANDNFANALTLTGASGSTGPINVSAATVEASEPTGANWGDPPAQTVWYKWRAPDDSTLHLSVADGSLDPRIAVWTGTTLAGLVEVGSADTASNPLTLNVTVTAGTYYYIHLSTAGDRLVSWTLSWTTSITNVPRGVSIAFSAATFNSSPTWSRLDA